MPGAESIDLHVHSTYSDGVLSPRQVAERAAQKRVVALAITDHDTMAGCDVKQAACAAVGVECVIGVELSCEFEGRETHILSLFADPASPHIGRVEEIGRARKKRMTDMLDRLDAMGIHMELSELQVGDDDVFGRPHLARALVAKRIVKSVNEAFARYLYDDGPVYIPKLRLSAPEGIDLAKRLGGVAVLAHPGVSGLLSSLDALADIGMEGIEVYHPKHGGETIAKLLRYCRERGLAASGGSDFHSPKDTPDIGSSRAPVELLEPLRQLAGKEC
ncbi:MAG: PHP domain-containing protein [Planctomycetes bacterium]|nr:PHP domain-containing protein [Planctomycetota bacterium]